MSTPCHCGTDTEKKSSIHPVPLNWVFFLHECFRLTLIPGRMPLLFSVSANSFPSEPLWNKVSSNMICTATQDESWHQLPHSEKPSHHALTTPLMYCSTSGAVNSISLSTLLLVSSLSTPMLDSYKQRNIVRLC